jgi:Tripartite tricarboxylate transporter family receptor
MVADHQGVEDHGGINPTVPIGPPILVDLSGGRNEISTPQIFASGRGRRCAPGRVARCTGAKLSDAAGALGRRVPAGGGTDIIARLIGQWLSERLAQPFIIENRPGASSNIATEAVAHALPDGYTRFMFDPSPAVNATFYDKLNL